MSLPDRTALRTRPADIRQPLAVRRPSRLISTRRAAGELPGDAVRQRLQVQLSKRRESKRLPVRRPRRTLDDTCLDTTVGHPPLHVAVRLSLLCYRCILLKHLRRSFPHSNTLDTAFVARPDPIINPRTR